MKVFKASLLFFILILVINIFPQNGKDTVKYDLDQVVVSATRYPELIFEIPYAVSILSPRDLSNIRGNGIDEVFNKIPGVLAQSRSGSQDVRIVIRGYGARGSGDRSNAGTSRGIRIMSDGIPETEPDGRTSFDLIDLSLASNVEIIRSNSSSLWGNASGGIVNITTIPEFNSYYGLGQVVFGSYGYRKSVLQAGSTFDNGKLFFSYSNTDSKGWRDRSGSTKSLMNLGVKTKLSERSNLGIYLSGVTSVFHIPGPLTLNQFNTNPQQSNTTYASRDERRFNRLGRIGMTLDVAVNNNDYVSAMVFVNPKYLQRSERGTFRDFTRYHLGGNILYHNNVNFSSSLNSKFVVGVDEAYQDGAILFYNLSKNNLRGDSLRTNKREGANTMGAFVQEELVFGDKLSVIVGGRYDNVKYYSEEYANSNRKDVVNQQRVGLSEKTFEKFTPKAGITYRFTPSFSVYANLGGGVEVPAGNETDPIGTYGQDTVSWLNPLLEPITSTTYEIGLKQIFNFDNSEIINGISYDLAMYYLDVKNDIVPYSGGRFYFTAGKTRRMGVELGLEALLNYGITVNGAFTYSDNKYVEYLVDSIHYGKPGQFADFKDNKVAGIPNVFYNAGLKLAPSFFYGGFISINMNGMGKYFVDDANNIEVPSYNIMNLSFGIDKQIKLTENLFIKGFVSVSNLTDEKYAASAFINPDLVKENGKNVPVYLEPGMPRTVSVSVSLGWK